MEKRSGKDKSEKEKWEREKWVRKVRKESGKGKWEKACGK
jgi:hypothetical protein